MRSRKKNFGAGLLTPPGRFWSDQSSTELSQRERILSARLADTFGEKKTPPWIANAKTKAARNEPDRLDFYLSFVQGSALRICILPKEAGAQKLYEHI